MRGDTVLRLGVHFFSAYLYLDNAAVAGKDGGMQGLVTVGFGEGDVVLDFARERLPKIVDKPQHAIAVGHRAHDNAQGGSVIYFVDVMFLALEFAPQTKEPFNPIIAGKARDAALPQF